MSENNEAENVNREDGTPENTEPENSTRDKGEREGSGGKYGEWTRELVRIGDDIARMRPAPELSANVRGMPIVMRALLMADAPLSPGELARAAGVTDARMANILRALEQKGLVTRKPSEHDRRRVEVSVTERGREASKRHFDEAMGIVEDFLREMGERDAGDFVRVLERVRDVMATRRAEGRQVCPDRSKGGGC